MKKTVYTKMEDGCVQNVRLEESEYDLKEGECEVLEEVIPSRWDLYSEDYCKVLVAQSIRTERERLLNNTDKYMVADFPSPVSKDLIQTYRRELRDMTETNKDKTHPIDVEWPVSPIPD